MIRVLVIEDDVRIAQINRRFVEKVDGFEVVGIATNGQEAHEHLEILTPDLVLLDLHFPDMNGLDLLKHIHQNHPQTDVIIITAAKEFDAVKAAIRGGVYDFMIKPVVFERFQEKLASYQKYRQKMNQLEGGGKQVDQEGIDQLLWGMSKAGDRDSYLPKGIDKLTLEKITSFIHQGKEELTAEELGRRVGVSRTTARRYLEYFVSKGELVADISYGTVGRPERVYKSTR
ncbi:response regulator [Paenibacillus sp. sptzw28]|uniref:response regulator n=1 Tax=Paenibacillus sp. sptzw28 TaxID=715179 RepID=UPI001C6E4C9F|nr:response regulator [Paenibacillus sp. sptzw28]QYR21811.1 response regulator [Paenibacillus sp. sptzw28]